MSTLTAEKARATLDTLMASAAQSHEPICISGSKAKAVLIAEEDWRAIQETLYLLSIPGMRKSIRKGLATPVSKCAKRLTW